MYRRGGGGRSHRTRTSTHPPCEARCLQRGAAPAACTGSLMSLMSHTARASAICPSLHGHMPDGRVTRAPACLCTHREAGERRRSVPVPLLTRHASDSPEDILSRRASAGGLALPGLLRPMAPISAGAGVCDEHGLLRALPLPNDMTLTLTFADCCHTAPPPAASGLARISQAISLARSSTKSLRSSTKSLFAGIEDADAAPFDWVQRLYLRPPRGSEMLVQVCTGRGGGRGMGTCPSVAWRPALLPCAADAGP